MPKVSAARMNVHETQDRGDTLSEEDKRTLVVGGWLQDTRRGVIEEESSVLLGMDEIKALIDADRLAIYGPRRSVGMLKFTMREGEKEGDMRNRMWQTIKVIARVKHVLPSTRLGGDQRTLWASFVKTKNARVRSTHVSLIRRVTIGLARESEAEDGAGVNAGLNSVPTAYDCDWNMGTIWCGSRKLGSCSHRAPKDEETVVMPGGWVSLTAVAQTAACSTEKAKRAFELEL